MTLDRQRSADAIAVEKERQTFWRATPEQLAEQENPSASRSYTHNAAVGRLGERLAEQHFVGLGATLLERNYRQQYGEIDLIFEHDGDLVAVEVKTRDVEDLAHPLEVLTFGQLRRIAQALTRYAQDNELLERAMRIDLVAIRMATDGGVEDFEHVRSIYPG
jgi:putative endonuclease